MDSKVTKQSEVGDADVQYYSYVAETSAALDSFTSKVPCDAKQSGTSAIISTRSNHSGSRGNSHKLDASLDMEAVFEWGSTYSIGAALPKQRTAPLHIVWPHRW